jgi:hypothetical protein
MTPQRCVLRLAWRKVSHSCNPQACQKRADRQKANPLCKLSSAVLLTQPLDAADGNLQEVESTIQADIKPSTKREQTQDEAPDQTKVL